jgi:hypothetical protein
MNVLTLSIKQKYFDEILAGTKKVETREVRPKNFAKYARFLAADKEYKDINEVPEDISEDDIGVVPVKYDALKLLTGEYKGKRPYVVVEIAESEVYFLTDKDGQDIILEDEEGEYIATNIEYKLGRIIEKRLYDV